MWTGKGYTCAYQAKSGKKKIGAFNTHTWMHNTAYGYTKRDHRWKQTGGVKVSYVYVDGGGNTGSSITFTAFNGEDGSRHWGAAVMWNTQKAGKIDSSQYKGDSYEYKTTRFYQSKISASGPTTANAGTPTAYSVKVTDPDGKSTPTGGVILVQQVGSKQDPPGKDCSGTPFGSDKVVAKAALSNGAATLNLQGLPPDSYNLYAVYAGSQNSEGFPLYCEKPTQNGLTAAASSTWTLTVGTPAARSAAAIARAEAQSVVPGEIDPGTKAPGLANKAKVKLVERTFTTGAGGGAAALPMACGNGWYPLQINAASPTRVLPEKLLTQSGGKVGIVKGAAPKGTKIDVQIICREQGAPKRSVGKLVVGTAGSDVLRTAKAGSTVLAGPGHDVIRVTKRGSSAFGFVGRDRIVLTANRGSAHGGPGADYLEARTPGAVVLVGGLGRDTLVGAKGRTMINAKDGSGGDTIICRSSKNIVHADKGDKIQGPCHVHTGTHQHGAHDH